MNYDELVIQIRATAAGVKQGVSVAAGEFRKLQAQKDQLAADLRMKLNAPELKKLQGELDALINKKKGLEDIVKFRVDSGEVSELRRELAQVEAEISGVENAMLTMKIDPASRAALAETLKDLAQLRDELRDGIEVQLKADTEQAKRDIVEVSRDMAKAERNIQIQYEVSGIDAAKKKLEETTSAIRETERAGKEMGRAISAGAVAAAGALAGIVAAAKSGAAAYNESIAATEGLRAVTEQLGGSVSAVMDVVREKTADALLSPADAAAAIKNLTQYGFSLEQASKAIDRLKDSAALNRQSHLSLSEAVKVTTDGIRQENSVLSDAAGVTKNIAKMWDDYAKSMGVSAQDLTQAQKAQAVYNGILEETEAFAGAAAAQAETLAGAQAQLAAEGQNLATAYGAALEPALQAFFNLLTESAQAARKLTETHPELVRGATVLAAGFLGVATAMKAVQLASTLMAGEMGIAAVAAGILTGAARVLNGALLALEANPAMAWFLAISAVIAGTVAAFSQAQKALKEYEEEQRRANEAVAAYNALMESPVTIEKAEEYHKNAEAARALRREIEQLIQGHEQAAESASKAADARKQMSLLSRADQQLQAWFKENKEQLSALGIETEKTAGNIGFMRKALEALGGVLAENNAKEREAAALAKEAAEAQEHGAQAIEARIKSMKALEDAQNRVIAGGRLSADELLNLIDANQELARWISNTADWQDHLADKLVELSEAERQKAIATLESEAAATQAAITGARDRINAMMSELNAMNLMGSMRLRAFTGSAEISEERKKLEEESGKYEAIMAKIAALRDGLGASGASRASFSGSSGGGSRSTARAEVEKSEEELLKERLEAAKKEYENEKALSELSVTEQIARLEQLRKGYQNYAEGVAKLDAELYALRRQESDEWYQKELAAITDLGRGMAERTDIQELINRLKALKEQVSEIYKDYPERMKAVQDELDSVILSREQDRVNKLLQISSNAVDALIAAQDRRIAESRLKSGIVFDGEEYVHTTDFEADAYRQKIQALDSFINTLMTRESELTDAEYTELQKRLKERKSYYEKLQDLSLMALKESQAAERKGLEAVSQTVETSGRERIEAAKRVNQAILDEIKRRYEQELQMAEAAASAEIAVYENRLKEIDALLKAESRAETDVDQLDKIRRLKEQLAYEPDAGNRYELQKEISSQEAEYAQRKRRETLEDERDALRQSIEAVKASLTARKQAINEAKEAEIQAAQEAQAAYQASLEAQSAALSEKEAASTELLREAQKTRQTDDKKYLEEKKKRLDSSLKDERNLIYSAVTNVINDLYARVWEFEQAGRRAGEAYAYAFQQAASAAGSGGGGWDDDASYRMAAAPLTLNIEYNVPVVTPSVAAADVRDTVSAILRR